MTNDEQELTSVSSGFGFRHFFVIHHSSFVIRHFLFSQGRRIYRPIQTVAVCRNSLREGSLVKPSTRNRETEPAEIETAS